MDYLGTHQHLAVDLDLSVDDTGALILTSDAQRFYEGLSPSDSPCSSAAARASVNHSTTKLKVSASTSKSITTASGSSSATAVPSPANGSRPRTPLSASNRSVTKAAPD